MNSRLIVLIALSCPSQIGTAVRTRIGAAMKFEILAAIACRATHFQPNVRPCLHRPPIHRPPDRRLSKQLAGLLWLPASWIFHLRSCFGGRGVSAQCGGSRVLPRDSSVRIRSDGAVPAPPWV